MRIIHHFGLNISREEYADEFSAAGIQLDRGPANLPGSNVASFEIAEDDPRWPEAQLLAAKCKITHFVRTEFSDLELESADVLCMVATGNRGYPEPSKGLGYLESTYDVSEYCSKCGVGLRQVRPFQIGFIPNLNRSILQLNWVFDEFFVDANVWAAVFEPFGIGCWPVLSSKTGNALESIVQLQISERAQLNIEPETLSLCSRCGRTKSAITFRGFAPSPCRAPASIFRSNQYFGTDANAFSRIFVRSPVFEQIRRAGLRGIEFYPCLPAGEIFARY